MLSNSLWPTPFLAFPLQPSRDNDLELSVFCAQGGRFLSNCRPSLSRCLPFDTVPSNGHSTTRTPLQRGRLVSRPCHGSFRSTHALTNRSGGGQRPHAHRSQKALRPPQYWQLLLPQLAASGWVGLREMGRNWKPRDDTVLTNHR